MELFIKEVRVGSVLVMHRVAVLVMTRREYENIMLNNLISLYTKTSVKPASVCPRRTCWFWPGSLT